MNEILEHYVEIVTDPAHTLVELTFIVVVDVLLLGVLWPLVKRHFHKDIDREHALLDLEHGVSHDGPAQGVRVLVVHPDGSLWLDGDHIGQQAPQ